MVDDCRLQADSLDVMLSEGGSENRHGTCCARLDDFNWVVPPSDPDKILPGWEMDVEILDVDRDICVLRPRNPCCKITSASTKFCRILQESMHPSHVRATESPMGSRAINDLIPVDVDKMAVEPLSFPVVVLTRPQVGCDPDLYLSKRHMEVDIVDTRRDIRNLPGMVPALFDETAAMPMTLPVDEKQNSQVEEGPDVV